MRNIFFILALLIFPALHAQIQRCPDQLCIYSDGTNQTTSESCGVVEYDVPYVGFKPKRVTTYEEEDIPVYRRRCHCRIVPVYYTITQRRLIHEYNFTTDIKNRVKPRRERFYISQPYTAYRRECYYLPNWNQCCCRP